MSVERSLNDRLQAAFSPVYLEVANESHMHGGPAMESHFKAVIVSERFEGQSLIQRHRAVHEALGELMGRFHALALHTYTPDEWARRAGAPVSPPCRGGGRA